MKNLPLALTLCILLTTAPLPSRAADGETASAAPMSPQLFAQSMEMARVMIELADVPTAQTARRGLSAEDASTVQRRQFVQINRAQQLLVRTLRTSGAQVLFRTQRVFNGIAVEIEARQLVRIAALPNVKAIHRLVAYQQANKTSIPSIKAPAVWDAAGLNLTGVGVTIGIIDTGIDYTHLDFGGVGGFDANNGAIIEAGSFPTAKVVGGIDLVGDRYNATEPSKATPAPDADPLDCKEGQGGGHGTHVAGTAAGFGVSSDGSTYSGPYGPTTNFTSMKIGPGVAPQASLYAIRIFGCKGSSDLVPQALDYAVDPNGDGDTSDHLDIVNMSLGSPFGGHDDVSAAATSAAIAAGVVVVASAGNSGDTTSIISSPASAEPAISVAASVNRAVTSSADETFDTLATFSSRGPRRDGLLKPDIVAPGSTIFSARAGYSSEGVGYSGTSMAAPHVAGALALLRQLHPSWTPQQLKALVMNTATHDLLTSSTANAPIYGPVRVGAGLIDLANAATQTVLAFDSAAPHAVGMSFGHLQVVSMTSITRKASIVNTGSSAVTLMLSYRSITTIPGVAYEISPSTLTIGSGETAEVLVTLTANPVLMQRSRDVTMAVNQNDYPRHYLSEASGYLTLVATAGTALWLPIYASARPASQMAATYGRVPLPDHAQPQTVELALYGKPSAAPSQPALVSAYELQAISLRITAVDSSEGAADLAYVGVMSDYRSTVTASVPNGAITDSYVYFAIATQNPWGTPNEIEFRIAIDNDHDGQPNVMLFNASLARFRGGGESDVFVSVLCLLDAGGHCLNYRPLELINANSAESADTGLFNSRVMVLGAAASDLMLSSNLPDFDYVVSSYSRESDALVDSTPALHFDPTKPAVDTSGGQSGLPAYLDTPNTTIPVVYTPSFYRAGDAKGVLLLHHNNPASTQPEAIGRPAFMLLPLVER